jgi:uncharacterized YigZ family protein
LLSRESFITVQSYTEVEMIIQKSRFITVVERVETEEEALRLIQKVKKKYEDASHHCYGYTVHHPTEILRFSDDGEPAGTAGRPILEGIKNRQLRNTVVVVTRYFGGIKLGAAGLVRAYSQGTSAGLDRAGLVNWMKHRRVEIVVDYPAWGKVEYQLRQMGWEMDSPVFTDRVRWSLWVPVGEEPVVQSMVAEHTSGTGTVTLGRVDYRPRNGYNPS